jgi:DNA-directed RNA polymerase beta subunit
MILFRGMLSVPTKNKSTGGNVNTILSRKILNTYFKSFDYPFVRHHIDSYDQLLTQDIPAVLKASNPFLILKELIPGTTTYMYRVEIFIGGLNGDALEIGTPTISLQKAKEVRVLFPNEARLRNLTYASTVYADVLVSNVTGVLPGASVNIFSSYSFVKTIFSGIFSIFLKFSGFSLGMNSYFARIFIYSFETP